MICSLTAGRARIRSQQLRTPETQQAYLAALDQIAAVSGVEANPKVGSLLVTFDATQLSTAAMRGELEALNDRLIPCAATERPTTPAPKASACPRASAHPAATPATSLNLGQGVKLGMMGSLASSMYWAVAGKKGPHKQTGAVFLACMAAHMWKHRQRLLK